MTAEQSGSLLAMVDHIAATGDTRVQRQLFARVEAAARHAGHGPILDAWSDDLNLMRSETPQQPGR